jgi:hypothetical protein
MHNCACASSIIGELNDIFMIYSDYFDLFDYQNISIMPNTRKYYRLSIKECGIAEGSGI